MDTTRKYPDLYVMSKFPGISEELKKVLPKEVNMIIVPISDKRIKWDTSINISQEEIDFVRNAEVIVIDSMFLAKMLYKLPNAKWVQNTWAGAEMLFKFLDPSKPIPDFLVTRYVDPYFGELMANYVIAQIINIERGFYNYRDKQKVSEWARPFFPNFRVLSDLTVGILGAGRLGSSIGKLLKKGGCYVIAYVRKERGSISESYDKSTVALNDIMEECDYICNVLPSTKETIGLLDGDIFKCCKKKPVFINIGRGDIIKEQTLIKALQPLFYVKVKLFPEAFLCPKSGHAITEGWISKAILDVFDVEPLSANSRLWTTPEVYITPHVGAIPRIDGIAKFIADNYLKYVNEEPLMNLIDWNQGY